QVNVVVVLSCLVLAATFHQALYIVIPSIYIFHVSKASQGKLSLNPIVKFYLYIVITVTLFVVIQSLLSWDIQEHSIKGIVRYVSYFMFAMLVYSFDINKIDQIFKTIILYFIITLPLGIYQVIELGRYQNIFRHANHLAYVLVMCIYFLAYHRPFNTVARLSFIVLLFISLLLTKSTGGIAVLLCIVGYNILISKRISFKRKLLLCLSFSLVFITTIVFSEKVTNQLESTHYLTWDFLMDRVENYRPGGYGSLIWRAIYWMKILTEFFSESFYKIIFGIGVDSLTEGNMPYSFMEKDPHNDYLKVMVEFGVLGLLLFLGLFKRVYGIVNKNFNIIILLTIPMFFGNIIVNFPFNITFVLLIVYEYKRNYSKSY